MGVALSTATVEQTREVGEALVPQLEPGDVVSLTGELGAGKTSFVQGVARGLGVSAGVVSPTFTLVREYRGRLTIHHVDVYRLERLQDVIDLGFDEMVDSDGVTFIEWGDVIERLLHEYLQVEFTVPEFDSDARLVRMTPAGQSWERRMEGLRAATGRFAK